MNQGNDIYTLHPGHRPLLISIPHAGTAIPAALRGRYVPRALQAEDTDWHLERLYAFAAGLGASLIVPRHSRYVIDLNRPSDNQPMYAGRNNTELCPTRFFTGEPLYREGQAPGDDEVRQRVDTYWRPYHEALAAELARLKEHHGHVVLFDAHSIRSELPWLFEGTLPHLNLGTVDGRSCHPSIASAIEDLFAAQQRYSWVVDGRFKGGYITRHYGRPEQGIHAVQLEMAWRTYMPEESPFHWSDELAQQVTPLLQGMVQAMISWWPHR